MCQVGTQREGRGEEALGQELGPRLEVAVAFWYGT